jgi:hypothetical protein
VEMKKADWYYERYDKMPAKKEVLSVANITTNSGLQCVANIGVGEGKGDAQ